MMNAKNRIILVFLKLVLPLVFCVIVGGLAGWGYKYASGGRSGRRSNNHTPKLSWQAICKRKKDIKKGAIIGGIAGIVILGLIYKNTMESINNSDQ